MKEHASDCSLHNGPALPPFPCDCGSEPGMTPEEYGSEYPLPYRYLHMGITVALREALAEQSIGYEVDAMALSHKVMQRLAKHKEFHGSLPI